MESLEELRKKIDEIDSKLADLLINRMKLSKEIGEFKKKNNIAVFDPLREEELKKNLLSKVDPEFKTQYSEILDKILKISKDIQL